MQLNQKLVQGSTAEFSAPVSMNGANHAHFELFLYAPCTALVISVEESNDAENWTTRTAQPTVTKTIGVNGFDASEVMATYIRLKYSGFTPTVVIGCNVHLSSQ